MFRNKIEKYIAEKRLMSPSDMIIVALSGGADSVALIRVLVELGYKCEGAHCNFHLRGSESDRDEEFVRNLCREINVPLNVVHFETEEYAAQNGISIEMAARELRYSWFEKLRIEKNADAVAVAHHKDDSVETFLLNLSRGTGINGLKGIMPRNGFIVRPFLEIGRRDILEYLACINQSYVTDSTNLEDIYTRNKIRLGIIPMFSQINPSFVDSVAETASRLSDVAAIYKTYISQALERLVKIHENDVTAPYLYNTVNIDDLLGEVSPQAILFEWLSPMGFNSSQIKDIMRSLSSESGRRFYSQEWELLRDRTQLIARKITTGSFTSDGELSVVTTDCNTIVPKSTSPIAGPGDTPISSMYAHPELHTETISVKPGFKVPRDNTKAYLDASKIKGELTLRKWHSGDKFVPFGMKGFKKVRDYLRDRKYSIFEKENVYVVTSGQDIVWIVGERTDNRFRVDDSTSQVIVLSCES